MVITITKLLRFTVFVFTLCSAVATTIFEGNDLKLNDISQVFQAARSARTVDGSFPCDSLSTPTDVTLVDFTIDGCDAAPCNITAGKSYNTTMTIICVDTKDSFIATLVLQLQQPSGYVYLPIQSTSIGTRAPAGATVPVSYSVDVPDGITGPYTVGVNLTTVYNGMYSRGPCVAFPINVT